MIEAVVFDLDGVLVDSELLWDAARRQVANEHGGRWRQDATAAMQGMGSSEWSAYLRDQLGVDLHEQRIVELVVAALLDRYRQNLPLLPGALEAVARIGHRWPLGLASSANRPVIGEFLALSGLADAFAVTVSSDEVPRGKPHPDVYLETCRRLGVPAGRCVAVEDSSNGITAAVAAGMRVAAIPNRDFPPDPRVLGEVDLVVDRLYDLTVSAISRLDGGTGQGGADRVDEQEIESFPASDSHSDWAGPPV
ncbi:MAG: HAD family hydrolase [Acidimicrobiales bacterium]